MINLYMIYDLKGNCYEQGVYTFISDVDALRFFDLLVFSKESKFNKYPEDFNLMCVGTVDLVSGRLESSSVPRLISSAEDRVVYYEVQKVLRDRKVEHSLEVSNND